MALSRSILLSRFTFTADYFYSLIIFDHFANNLFFFVLTLFTFEVESSCCYYSSMVDNVYYSGWMLHLFASHLFLVFLTEGQTCMHHFDKRATTARTHNTVWAWEE